jgi:cobalt-zinc-cadmium efflux system protein
LTGAASASAGHHHVHDGRRSSDRAGRLSRMRVVLVLTVGVLLVEAVGGILSGSLALVADAAHMFMDVAALTLAYAGLALGGRAPTGKHTFGLARAEVLAAFVNAQLLLVGSAAILFEAWRRFRAPAPVHTGLMLGVAAVGLAVNVTAALMLRHGHNESLGMRAAYLEVATDAFSSLAVIVAAVAISRTGWYALDPILSAAIALFILPRGIGILRDAAHILLEGAPPEIDVASVRAELCGLPGVAAVHDLHFWTLTSGMHSASVHILAAASASRDELLPRVQRLLLERAGVEHATIQVEQGGDVVCLSTAGHA